MSTVAYYRVSTARQGASGLGLEAQRAAVRAYLKGEPRAEYQDIESGAHDDRPQLAAALAECRLTGATLVIAKLDRLSRNAAFLMSLRDSEVDFVCCDMPKANRLTVGIMAVMAEHERSMISERTKAALAAVKARGVKLGNPRGAEIVRRPDVRAANREALHAAALRHARKYNTLLTGEFAGVPAATVAATFNERGYRTARGGRWHPATVARLRTALGITQ